MRRLIRRAVEAVTLTFLTVALVLSIVWFFEVPWGSSRFEPAVECIGFVGGLIGVVIERRAARLQRREQTLLTIGAEVVDNQHLLQSPSFQEKPRASGPQRIYPRLRLSAVEAALASGALLDIGDPELLRAVHKWRDDAVGFNHRLDLMELRGVLVERDGEPQVLHAQMARSGGPLERLTRAHAEIVELLRSRYGSEEAVRSTLGAAAAAAPPATPTPPATPGRVPPQQPPEREGLPASSGH